MTAAVAQVFEMPFTAKEKEFIEVFEGVQQRAAAIAKEKGWDDTQRNAFEEAALFHSEISEYVEDLRNGVSMTEILYEESGKPYGPASELADAVIRFMHAAHLRGIPLAQAIARKMNYNATRPYRHGGKLA